MVIKERIFDEQVQNDEQEGIFSIDQGEESRVDEARGERTSQRDKETKVKDKEVVMSQGGGGKQVNKVSSPPDLVGQKQIKKIPIYPKIVSRPASSKLINDIYQKINDGYVNSNVTTAVSSADVAKNEQVLSKLNNESSENANHNNNKNDTVEDSLRTVIAESKFENVDMIEQESIQTSYG